MLKILLFPFSVLYDAVTRLRNHLYDRGLKPSVRFDVPVIGIGNLAIGGTGKTPMTEYLIRLLSSSYDVATLSRGYGRKTRGFRIAGESDNAQTMGDEPFQYYRKFASKIMVAVGEERALAIPSMLQEKAMDVILLDDAFQHRQVRPSLNILLTDFHRPFYHDLVLPAGRLRESAAGAQRADLIVVTKCPVEINEEILMEIEKNIRRIAEKPVFFSNISYGNPIHMDITSAACSREVILVSGIASETALLEYVRRNFVLIEHFSYPDHHEYTRADLHKISEKATKPDVSVITTEKDMVKIDVPEFEDLVRKIPFFYIPITVQFLKDEEEFDEVILNHVRERRDKKLDEKDR